MAMNSGDVWKFEEELKARSNIADLFTHHTKIEFQTVNGAKRARVPWREDNTPSLHFHPGKNILTDFGAPDRYAGKRGDIINHFDLLIRLGVCANRREAVKWLAEYVHIEIPKALKPTIERAGREQDALRALWKACRDFAFEVCSNSASYEAVTTFCAERNFPLENDFFKSMEIGVWPTSRVINKIIEEHKLDAKDSKLTISTPVSFESRALVFPLFNKNGALTGLTVRNVETKKFLKFAIDDSGAYGLISALKEEHVAICEGQLNRIQMAAALRRLHGEDWQEHMPAMLSTGSNSFDLAQLKDVWKDALYIPDYDVQLVDGDTGKREVFDTVLGVYNALKAQVFNVISWKDAFDKFDLDDFLKQRVGNEAEALKELAGLRSTMAEFTRDWIEHKVKDVAEKQKDSARYAYCKLYGNKFYNPVDKSLLLSLYSFIDASTVDQAVVDETTAGHEEEVIDGVVAFHHAYYRVEQEGENRTMTKISGFVFDPLYKIIQKPPAKEVIGEFEGQISELHSLHANLWFENGLRFPITFEHGDLIDVRGFLGALSKAHLGARTSIVGGKQSEMEVFQCALKKLDDTTREVLRLRAAGPHLRDDTPEHRRNGLRPAWFGNSKATKTYLCRGHSVIDGEIVTNQSVNLEFQTSDCYNFSVYSDEEHIQTSRLIWNTMRKVHREWFIDSMLGLVCATPIKHLINQALNGTVVVLLGQTEAHKTSTALIMSNFFGDVPSDSYLSNFNSTPLAFELNTAQAGAVFMVCDEFKPTPNFRVDHLGAIIHNMYSGKTKSAMTTDRKSRDVYQYTGTYVMTGEQIAEVGSSTEARFILYRIERHDAQKEYEEIMLPENLQKLKCWTPRLICWQHQHITELQEFYQKRRVDLKDKLKGIQNAVRVADQQAFVETGFYAFCHYLESLDVITTEERIAAMQKYLIWSERNIVEQIGRSEETTNTKKFLQYMREMLDSGVINFVTFIGDGQNRSAKFSQDQKRPYAVIIFEQKGETKYVITSFDAFIRDMCRHYGRPDMLTNSIKFDLQEQGLIKLEPKGGFAVIEIPDPQNPTKKRRIRAPLLTHKDLYGDLNDNVNRDSGLSGDSED